MERRRRRTGEVGAGQRPRARAVGGLQAVVGATTSRRAQRSSRALKTPPLTSYDAAVHKKCKKEAVTQPLNVKDWIRALTDEFPHLGSERAR